MRVTIYQPQYFPRLHYFNRILSADKFVLLDSAQYTKTLVHEVSSGRERHKSYQADAPIKTSAGEYLLTISTKHTGEVQSIKDTPLEYMHKWHRNHLMNIKANYRKAGRFEKIFPEIEALLLHEYESLALLNHQTILWGLAVILGLDSKPTSLTIAMINKGLEKNSTWRLKHIVQDTELGVSRPEGRQKGTEWTAALCEALGATEYLHGGTAQTMYMDVDYYKKRGIVPVVQNWKCSEYKQQYPHRGFMPNLSIIDLLLNEENHQVNKILN